MGESKNNEEKIKEILKKLFIPDKPKTKNDFISLFFQLVSVIILSYLLFLFITEYRPYIQKITSCEVYFQEKMKEKYEIFNISMNLNGSWDSIDIYGEKRCPPCPCLN